MADPFAQIPKEALDYFRAKGFKIGFDYREVWKEEHTAAFTVAKAMQFDLLADIRAAVDQALANGETFRDFQKRLTPLLVQKGWWGQQEMMDPKTGELKPVQLGSPRRLRVIYDTNLRTARAAGQWQRIQESKKSLPYLLYTVGPSREHRPEHLAWHGTLLPVDDPWWQTHFAPNGWGCKCRIRQVTKYEYEKLLKTGVQAPPSAATQEINPETGRPTGHSIASKVPVITKAPPLNLQPWTNKRTGVTEQVPQGIDPGWDYNPGASRLAHLEKMLKEKEAAFSASPPPAPATWRDAMDDPEWLGHLEGYKTGAGWLEEGGRVILDENGQFLMRSKWLAKEQWWADYVSMNSTGRIVAWKVKAAIEKAMAGKKLGKAEDRFLSWLHEYTQEQKALQQELTGIIDPLIEQNKVLLREIKARFIEQTGDAGNEMLSAMMEDFYGSNPYATIAEANQFMIAELKDWLGEK